MPDTKVGKLDHPERYGRRSVAVYSNSNGLYFIHDGVREDVHGNQLWTTISNVKMRGESPVSAVPGNVAPHPYAAPVDAAADFDQNELSAAIAASLAESPYERSLHLGTGFTSGGAGALVGARRDVDPILPGH